MQKIYVALIICTLTSFFFACSSDNVEDIFPCGSLANISYVIDVAPIIDGNCYQCHDATNAPFAGSNIQLDDYNMLLIYVRNGKLACVVNHNDGCTNMPYGQTDKIAPCSISKIEAWIAQGATNN